MNAKHLYMAILVLLFASPFVFAAVEPLSVNEMNEKSTITVLETGDMQVEEIIVLSASAFQNFKQAYPTLSMFSRLFSPRATPIQIEELKINVDDMKNTINATYIQKGGIINKGEYWEALIGKEGEKITLSAQTGNTLVFTSASTNGDFNAMVTITAVFPQDAKNIKFDSSANKITYELPYKGSGANWIFMASAAAAILLAIANQFFLDHSSRESHGEKIKRMAKKEKPPSA